MIRIISSTSTSTSTLCILVILVLYISNVEQTYVHASQVLELTDTDFTTTIQSKPNIMVAFVAGWCHFCVDLHPKYDRAAEILGDRGVMARVDCVKYEDFCTKEGVRGFPTIKYYADKVPFEYNRERTPEALAGFIVDMSRPAVAEADSVEEMNKIIAESHHSSIVIGFLGAKDESHRAILNKAGEKWRLHDLSFIVSSNGDAAKLHGVEKIPAFVVEKRVPAAEDASRSIHYGAFESLPELLRFLNVETFPLYEQAGPHNYRKYVERAFPLAFFFTSGDPTEYAQSLSIIQHLSQEFKGKASFLLIDRVLFWHYARQLGLSGTRPSLAINDILQHHKYLFNETLPFNLETVTQFFQAWTQDKVSPHITSEKAPALQNDAVYTVVGNNYENIVSQPRDVMISINAPSCRHCVELKPKYTRLAQNFAHDKGILIAQIDATQNDIPVEVAGYPTILFYPAYNKQYLTYDGPRTVSGLHEFIAAHRQTVAPPPPAYKDEL